MLNRYISQSSVSFERSHRIETKGRYQHFLHTIHSEVEWIFSVDMKSKVLLLGLTLATILTFSQAQEDKKEASGGSSGFLDRLCEKCSYCKTDPNCDGCAKCSQCQSRSQVPLENILPPWKYLNIIVLQEGCRFCKLGEDEESCRNRCGKGCRICGGKDGTGLDSCKNRGFTK